MKGKRTFKRFLAVVMAVVFTVTGITFTPSEKIEASTSKISVTNVPSGAWGGKKSKYQLGTTSDTSADGKWYLEVSQNQWGNWAGSYQNADGIDGFKFYNEVYNNAGGIFLWSSDLKTEKSLTAGKTYSMSVTINYTGVNAAQHNYVLTEGGSSNLNVSRTVSAGTSSETYTGTVVPTANNDLVLRVSYTSSGYATAEVGTFEVASVSFTEVTTTTPPITSNAQGYYNARTDADWHTIPTNGFQYFFNAGMTGSLYKGGTAINDPLHIRVGTYAADEGALQTKTPVVSVTAGRTYKLTYNVANTGSLNQGTNTIFAAVTNASNDQDIVNSYSSKVGVNAGDDVDIELTYTAPASGQVYFRLVVGWANLTEFVLTPTNEDITVDWIPTVSENTNIGSNGIKLYNKWTGNTEYFDGSLTSLQDARLKHVAVQQTNPDYYYAEAIRIPNNVAYANCTAGHKYRMTYTFDASQAGGKAILYQNGYNQGEEITIASGTNTISIDFISNANNNTNAYNTEFQFANATQGMEIDNMDYSFVEMPQTPNNIYGDVIGGNSLKVTWEPPADISGENYDVSLYSGSSATGTPVATATVTHANISAGHTFTGLTPGGTYTAKVESKLNGFTAQAITGTYTIDPWVPVATTLTAIGNDGTDIFNEYVGNTHYYTGTLTSLQNVKVKQTADPQTNPRYYYAEAIRIPNSVAYGSCVDEHLYRMTVTFDSSAAGGTVVLA
ncbi:MAG: fibronectin type III domain-containing protein, partial [Eubacterium sp.]|nr:fibronectin type III domain-containing protein [Eubacterium sp.]